MSDSGFGMATVDPTDKSRIVEICEVVVNPNSIPGAHGAMIRPMNKGLPVKLVVRHARSQKFLKSTGRWTKRVEAAFHFPNVINAIHTCLARGLKDVELVLRYGDGIHERRLPLNAA